jgi:catechol 2,3-dioxygenase-like lactoylglutathione lyase family enzyme
MVVRDLDVAAVFYRTVLGGREVDPTMRDGRRAFAVGEGTIVELVKAVSQEMIEFGDGVFGMTFHVDDADRAAQFLSEKGLSPSRMEDGALVVVSPEHALGTTLAFRQGR